MSADDSFSKAKVAGSRPSLSLEGVGQVVHENSRELI